MSEKIIDKWLLLLHTGNFAVQSASVVRTLTLQRVTFQIFSVKIQFQYFVVFQTCASAWGTSGAVAIEVTLGRVMLFLPAVAVFAQSKLQSILQVSMVTTPPDYWGKVPWQTLVFCSHSSVVLPIVSIACAVSVWENEYFVSSMFSFMIVLRQK